MLQKISVNKIILSAIVAVIVVVAGLGIESSHILGEEARIPIIVSVSVAAGMSMGMGWVYEVMDVKRKPRELRN